MEQYCTLGISNLYSNDAVILSIKMSKEPEYKKISVKEEFAQSIEDFIKEHPTLGYRSIAQFLEDSARHRLEELQNQIKKLPRFDRINGDATGVLIYDRELKDSKGVHISIRPSGIMCDFHQTNCCEHVKYALGLSDVQEMIRKRKKEGWKLDLPEE